MKGGFLSERDVCCRVYGIVAATEVEFACQEFSPENDQLQPVEVKIANKGRTAAEVLLEIIDGDASFVLEEEFPQNLEPYALQLWFGKQKPRTARMISLDINEIASALIIPGLQDSVVVIKKPLSAFGVMAAMLDRDLVDTNGNIVISAAKIGKRLEPLKPYVYLEYFNQSFEILQPGFSLLPDMKISTRPYNPIVMPFVIVNPASNQFDCEITLGQDLIAPQLIKVPPQSKAIAQFALNPDRSGDIESFIQFHDAQMRLQVTSFGPDVSIRCPFIKQQQNLYTKQGMVDISRNKKAAIQQTQSWEKLLEETPTNVVICPIEASDLNIAIQAGRRAELHPQPAHAQLDLTELQNHSAYETIIREMPYLEFQNQGSTQSEPISITVFNPTGSSMKIQPKIIPISRQFLKLQLEYSNDNMRRSLVAGGVFSQRGTIDSPYFVTSPQEVEVQSLGQTEIHIRATNMKRLGNYEGILQLNGIYLRLFCERKAPSVALGDGLVQINIVANYTTGAKLTLPVVNNCQAQLCLELSLGYPLKITRPQLVLEPLGNQNMEIVLEHDALHEHFQCRSLPKQPTLQDFIAAEKQQRTLSDMLRIAILNSENTYYQTYQLTAVIDAPLLLPRQRNVQFPPTFVRRESLQFVRFENQSAIPAKFSVMNVPLAEGIALRLDSLEGLESVEGYQQNYEERYARGVLDSAKITFTDLAPIFYDLRSECIVIDDPSLFQFSILSGTIGGHENRRPLKSEEFGIRIQPDEGNFDKTRDRAIMCKYVSLFYVAIQGGTGAFIVCEGSVNHNVDDI